MKTELLTLTDESGSTVMLKPLPNGGFSLEAKGALAPTIAAIDFTSADVGQIRAWLGKIEAATRTQRAREAVTR